MYARATRKVDATCLQRSVTLVLAIGVSLDIVLCPCFNFFAERSTVRAAHKKVDLLPSNGLGGHEGLYIL